MGKSNACETDVLAYVFQGVAPAWAAVTDLFASLHTSDPGEAGNQGTNETAYTGYSRVTISRSVSAWTLSSTTLCGNLGAITFPQCSAGAAVSVTHMGIGCSFSGAGELLYSGALTSALSVGTNITPTFDTSSVTVSEE
jgi:hypothetical protein